MQLQTSLDSIPISLVFAGFSIVSLAVYEIWFRIGRWWQKITPGETEGPTGVLVGSLLGLMAFLLAVTTGMASDRYDARRGIVLTEANAIGTTYLRASFLPEQSMRESRELLREYVPLRIATDDPEVLRSNLARSVEIHAALWSIAEEQARSQPESDMLGLYIESLNDTIDLHETRVVAGIYARVPETVILLLFLGAALTLSMVGYGAGLTGLRSPHTAIAMVALVGAVITVVVDLDRPQEGLLRVNQQPIFDLERQFGPP